MDTDCLNIEQKLRTPEGDLYFESMADVKRATDQFRQNPKDPKALDVINAYRHFRLHCLRTSLSILGKVNSNSHGLVSARLKRIKSIQRKLTRGQKGAINEMDDILGVRVICRSFYDAKALARKLKQRIPDSVIKDYLSDEHPAGTGYRAQHVIIRFKQPFLKEPVTVRFEIQIRTWYQHQWACWSESKGEHAKEGFKYTASEPARRIEDNELISNLRECSRFIAEWEHSNPQEIQKSLPMIDNLYNISLAWFNAQKKYLFDTFEQDFSNAVEMLYSLESNAEFEPILLVGVANPNNIQGLLRETHPIFMQSGFQVPEYWLPRV